MDGPRFDALTRTFLVSRRFALTSILGGACGALLGSGSRHNAAASCKRVGQNCDRNADCCDGATCRGGTCRCKSGRDECGGKCFNLDTDERHCRLCNRACDAGERCCSGSCVVLESAHDHCGACGVGCGEGALCCGGECQADRLTNPDHCGVCGNRCPGICTTLPGGPTVCVGPRCCGNGFCVDTRTDLANCGACGNACGAGQTCGNSECLN